MSLRAKQKQERTRRNPTHWNHLVKSSCNKLIDLDLHVDCHEVVFSLTTVFKSVVRCCSNVPSTRVACQFVATLFEVGVV